MESKIEQWIQIAEQWKNSGLTQKIFCEQQGIKLSTLKYWILRINKEKKLESTNLDLVRVSLPMVTRASNAIVIEIDNRYRISVSEGFHPETLQKVLAVFE